MISDARVPVPSSDTSCLREPQFPHLENGYIIPKVYSGYRILYLLLAATQSTSLWSPENGHTFSKTVDPEIQSSDTGCQGGAIPGEYGDASSGSVPKAVPGSHWAFRRFSC